MRNISFSVKPSDTVSLKLVKDVKTLSIQRGVNFSFIVLAALANYKRDVLDKVETRDAR